MSPSDKPKPAEVTKPVDDLPIESDPQSQPKPSSPEEDDPEIEKTEEQPS